MAQRETTDEPNREDEPPSGEHPAGPAKISTGVNARPRNETIAQSGGGLPNDSSSPIEIDPEEEKRIAAAIRAM